MIESITISPQRMLGEIAIDCTIREQHADDYTATDHPLEQGAASSDHVFRNPARLAFDIGFSNSSELAGGDNSYVIQKYEALLALQATREPMAIVTGKRTYKNMIILGLGVTTDQETEAVLMCTATCRELIIVQTQVTTVPPAAVHANAAKTGAVQNKGTVQAAPASLSPTGA